MKILVKILVAIMVLVGLLVGFLSVYHASFVGLFSQIGVDKIEEESIDKEELEKLMKKSRVELGCGVFNYFEDYVGYRRKIGDEKARLGFEIGERRIYCGLEEIIEGRERWGSYMVIKGLGYLEKSSGIFGKERVLLEEGMCLKENELAVEQAESSMYFLEGFLDATEGQLHDFVRGMYVQLKDDWREVSCLDPVN